MRIKINTKQLRALPKRTTSLGMALVLLFALALPVIFAATASAASAQLQTRSLTLSSSANGTITQDIALNNVAAGEGGNGQKTKETYKFTLPTAQNVGSIIIKICTDPIAVDATGSGNGSGTPSGPSDGSCNLPVGFDASNVVSIVTQLINGAAPGTAFTLDTATNLNGVPYGCAGGGVARVNCIAIKRTATAVAANDVMTLAFGGLTGDYITNPTADNTPFFARIQTYTDNAFTTKGDYGSVAASTAQQIDITAKVKEVLNFSVASAEPSGSDITAPTGVCVGLGNSNGGAIKLGDVNGVLSFNTAYDKHSYFRLSSNTNGGVQVLYSGDTLKNGSNSIAAIGTTAAFSTTNTAQFGLGIDSGDTQTNGYSFTNLAAAVVGTPSGSITDYSLANGSIAVNGAGAKFAFNTGSKTTPIVLAYSSGPVACDTGSVRYLGNISTATPAGIYTTTITYIATGIY